MTLQVSNATQIRFLVSGSFSPSDAGANWTSGTPDDYALTLSGLANSAARQSAKVDLGANRHSLYHLLACVDFTGESPLSTGQVRYAWLPSTSATTANGNIAGNSGVDALAPNGATPSGLTALEFLALGVPIGSLASTDDASVQTGYVGSFAPPTQYGQLLVLNQAGDAFEASDAQMHHILTPIQLSDA